MLESGITDQIRGLAENLLIANFRQSPGKIAVSLDERCMVIHLQRFIGHDMEELVRQKDSDALRTIRELIVEYIVPDLVESIRKGNGIAFDSIYYDWDDSDLSGMIIGLLDGNPYRDKEDYYRSKNEVHRQVDKITYDVQKVPDATYSYWIDPDTLVIVREGLFIKIEKELIKLGYAEILRKSKRSLEKTYFLNDSRVPEIICRTPAAFYVDWDFAIDKSVIVYRFN